MCLSLAACGEKNNAPADSAVDGGKNSAPANLVVDGKEISVTDFLIEHLNEYIQSEGYLERKADFEAIFGDEENNFSVTRVIEVSADNIGPDKLSFHFLEIKADCLYMADSSTVMKTILLVVDYNSGKLYDEFTVDNDWQNKGGVEQQTFELLHGGLALDDYDGGPLINDSETRTELAESEIAKINQVLIQDDPAVEDEKNSAHADLVMDGEERSVTDFLIGYLNEYVQSEGYLERKANYEAITGDKENSLSVTRVIDLSADNIGSDKLSVHFLAIKADCGWAVDSDLYDSILLIADYSSGKVYDEFTVDDDWQNEEGSMEQQIWYLLHGPLVGDDYDGGIILTDSETRTELAESEIAKINEAIQE